MYNMHLNHCVVERKIRTRLDLLSIPQYCVYFVVSLLYRDGAKTKLHQEYPHIIEKKKKTSPALKQEISVFCEPEHPKKHVTLR